MRDGSYRIWRVIHYFLYGTRRLTSTRTTKKIALRVQTDHEFTVHYEAISYVLRFTRWWIPDRQFVMYKLSATCGSGTPHKLKQAVQDPVYLPRNVFHSLNEKTLIENVRNAYIDVIVARVKRMT